MKSVGNTIFSIDYHEPLTLADLMSRVTGGVKDQEIFSLYNWCQIFKKSALELAVRMEASDGILYWDKV